MPNSTIGLKLCINGRFFEILVNPPVWHGMKFLLSFLYFPIPSKKALSFTAKLVFCLNM